MTSYPSAMRAIAEFRHEVFSILEQVAKPRKKPISQIVGDATFKRGSDEVDDFLDGSDTVLDVVTKGPCSFHIGVSWQDVDRHAGPVRIYARHRERAETDSFKAVAIRPWNRLAI